jgi:hypothetical protein
MMLRRETLALMVVLGACKGGGESGPTFEQLLEQHRAFTTTMCACADTACVDKVDAEIAAWRAKAPKGFKGKPTEAQDERWSKLDDERDACKAKVQSVADDAKAAVGLAKLKEAKDQICACADLACGEKVQAALAEWMAGPGASLATLKPSEAVNKQAVAMAEQMGLCLQKLAIAAMPPTPAP